MTAWKAKRFWKAAHVVECPGGYGVSLDARLVKTPAKESLVVPTRAMAQAIAAEWDAQQGIIDPRQMSVTRGANAAIDKVAVQFDEVVALIADYGGTDLLCYRAIGPTELVERQAAAWDPFLDWAAEYLGARLAVTSGVRPIAQEGAALARLRAEVASLSAFQLAALYDLVSITGSLVLGLAVAKGRTSASQAWLVARIDEHWQAEQWGEDEEASVLENFKREALITAEVFFSLASSPS
jgi:chaperone required for assembly of F1-ATPase